MFSSSVCLEAGVLSLIYLCYITDKQQTLTDFKQVIQLLIFIFQSVTGGQVNIKFKWGNNEWAWGMVGTVYIYASLSSLDLLLLPTFWCLYMSPLSSHLPSEIKAQSNIEILHRSDDHQAVTVDCWLCAQCLFLLVSKYTGDKWGLHKTRLD